VELGPLRVCAVRSPETPVVCGKLGWGGRPSAAVHCFEAASKLARSERIANSEATFGVAAAHGLRRLAAAM